MAKKPSPGKVKNRLITKHIINENGAAEIANAMMLCIASRLNRIFANNIILAVSPDNAGDLGLHNLCSHIINQGEGNLGEKLDRVWQQVIDLRKGDGPITFFGIDSPDIPNSQLTELKELLMSTTECNSINQTENKAANVIIGPTHDGGYWVLGAAKYQPELLENINWGGTDVYTQTVRNTLLANLNIEKLKIWHDVDDINDLNTLLDRIKNTTDPHLIRLYQSIKNIYPFADKSRQ